MKLVILPKTHIGIPSVKRTSSIRYTYQFVNYEYDIDVDQSDWNKLTGLKSHFLHPLSEDYMIVWRWYNSKLQLAFYSNISGDKILPPEESVITLPTPTTSFVVGMTITGNEVHAFIEHSGFSTFLNTWTYRKKPIWEISFWFGGNRTPNKTIVVNRQKYGVHKNS